jgi:hypothetical protein
MIIGDLCEMSSRFTHSIGSEKVHTLLLLSADQYLFARRSMPRNFGYCTLSGNSKQFWHRWLRGSSTQSMQVRWQNRQRSPIPLSHPYCASAGGCRLKSATGLDLCATASSSRSLNARESMILIISDFDSVSQIRRRLG